MSSFQENLKKHLQNKKPYPAWVFTAKNIALWITVFLFILGGIVFLSFVFQSFCDIERESFSFLFSRGKLRMFFRIFPIFLLFGVSVFFFSAYFFAKKTTDGYKYFSSKKFIILSTVSLILSLVFVFFSFPQKFHSTFRPHITGYDSFFPSAVSQWMDPEYGRLFGEVEEVFEDSFLLKDPYNQTWTVFGNTEKVQKKERVRILGKKLSETEFESEKILLRKKRLWKW
jgi:magnesium-transporting ATPase (P-type)